MEEESKEATKAALLKQLDIQWQDHFQTRSQTWKALEVSALVAVALVGLEWHIGGSGGDVAGKVVTGIVAGLLVLVAFFGMQITLRHRNIVEITKFRKITATEKQLGIGDPSLALPQPMRWWHVFLLNKSSTSLFILRMQFVILVFAIGYLVVRIVNPQ
jgi:hypothetical protein